jgi:NodT family efflux transporter outer membrane factor (OMF) lipoprotein
MRPTTTFPPLALLALLAGCTVGPDYHRPEAGAPGPAWAGTREAPAGLSSVPTDADPGVLAAWWDRFQDPTLSALIGEALGSNLSLAQAQQRIRQARAAVDIAGAAFEPTVDASGSASRSRSRAGTGNSYRAGFDASWEIDVFGGNRRAAEAADANLLATALDLEDLRVSLAAEVAATYLDLRGAQRQLAIARENLALQQQTLALTQDRFDAGFVSGLDVANARTLVANTTSQIPATQARIRGDMFALALLLSREPDALTGRLTADAPVPPPPASIPVGLPSDLLQRRPDLRRAEADLHAATAQVGVAVADQYPRFFLSGSAGISGSRLPDLSTAANRFWSLGPSISAPIFSGGRLEATVEQRRAAAEEALLAYRGSVLTALSDVETALVNFTREQERLAALEQSAASAKDALDLALTLYDAGRTDFLNVLSAQRELLSAQSSLAQSTTTISTNLVAVYKALGGGWDPAAYEGPAAERAPGAGPATPEAGSAPHAAP